jgi:hypothetical protein
MVASLALLAMALPASAQVKPCEELKMEIGEKMVRNGIKAPQLSIVDKDAQADGKVVGTCEGGTKKIVYRRGDNAPATGEPQGQKAPTGGTGPK